MITIGDWTLEYSDPRLWGLIAVVLVVLWLIRSLTKAAQVVEPIARHLAALDGAVRALNDGQNQLHGGFTHVA